MKLAVLIGVSGAGKGCVGKQLKQPDAKLKIDHIRAEVLNGIENQLDRLELGLRTRVADLLRGDNRNRWEIWETLCIPATEQFLTDLFSRSLSSGCPNLRLASRVFVEGGLYAMPQFRGAFHKGLASFGVVPTATTVFWLDPNNEQVLQQRKKRGRDSDQLATLETVLGERTHYERKVMLLEPVRCQSASEAVIAIDGYLGSP